MYQKIILSITLLTLIFSKNLYAQSNNKEFIIKTNLLSDVLKAPSLAFEIKTVKRMSLAVGFMAGNKSLIGPTFWADYRFYLGFKDTPTLKGFYVAPGFLVSEGIGEGSFSGQGGNIGYQYFDSKKNQKTNFSFDFNVGLYPNIIGQDKGRLGALPKITLAIGIASRKGD